MTLFHERGIDATTIANVASAAGVPPGNVYYHFRSKDALIAAVVKARRDEIKAELELAGCAADPLERLRSIIRESRSNRELLTAHGCPYASLAQGLRDIGGTLADDAGELLRLYLEFAQVQFVLLRKRNASELASDFIARLYGAFTLANALGDADFLDAQLNRIEDWLEGSVHGSKQL